MTQQLEETRGASEARQPFAPGLVFYAITMAVGLMLLAFDGAMNLMGMLIVLAFGILFALGWFVLFVATAVRAKLRLDMRCWLRWLGIPAIAALCFCLIVASVPLRLRFELSRPAFDGAAARVMAGETVVAGQIGLFHIDYVDPLSNGVWFEDDSAGFIDPCGLAYAPDGRPDVRFLEVDLGGGWWFACEDF